MRDDFIPKCEKNMQIHTENFFNTNILEENKQKTIFFQRIKYNFPLLPCSQGLSIIFPETNYNPEKAREGGSGGSDKQ